MRPMGFAFVRKFPARKEREKKMLLSECFFFFSLLASSAAAAFNAAPPPSGVDVWCGKAYMATDAAFDPGGRLSAPTTSTVPLLNLRVRPRMSFYVVGEAQGSVIVDAAISTMHGQPLFASSLAGTSTNQSLVVDIFDAGSGAVLVSKARVAVNTTGNEFTFSLSDLMMAAAATPTTIDLVATTVDGSQTFKANTTLLYLPPNPDVGASSIKVDALTSGLLVPSGTASNTWVPFYPYSFYTQWDPYLDSPPFSNLTEFAQRGYNVIHVVPGGDPTGFDFNIFNQFLDKLDEMGLWLMYDMRNTYQNLSSVSYQVSQLKSRKSLLLYYTADEPDGNTDPLNATSNAYSTITGLDPYHPVSLVLNCYNFYYEQYTSGADIILEDAYPLATNLTYSTVWNTTCNDTYGDCGCDGCFHDASSTFASIPARLDRLALYQEWLNEPKPLWGVPQAFGNQSYWTRVPTAEEEVVMTMLRVNHGAKGIVMWDWPEADDDGLGDVTSQLSSVFQNEDVVGFLLGSSGPTRLDVDGGGGLVDAAGWVMSDKMLVSIVSMDYSVLNGIKVNLGRQAKAVGQMYWGSAGWTVDGETVTKDLAGLEAGLFAVELS